MTFKHFHLKEFDCPCCGKNNIDLNLVKTLDKVRDELGYPIFITSGCRCEKHNAFVGGVKNSAHLFGLACDIRVPDNHFRLKLLKLLFENGISRMGIGENFIHIDIDSCRPVSAWTYYKNK